jgi:hypothetical protein
MKYIRTNSSSSLELYLQQISWCPIFSLMNALKSIFFQVKTLHDTIESILDGRDVLIEDDILHYLQTTIVCFDKHQTLKVKSVAASSHSSHQQV